MILVCTERNGSAGTKPVEGVEKTTEPRERERIRLRERQCEREKTRKETTKKGKATREDNAQRNSRSPGRREFDYLAGARDFQQLRYRASQQFLIAISYYLTFLFLSIFSHCNATTFRSKIHDSIINIWRVPFLKEKKNRRNVLICPTKSRHSHRSNNDELIGEQKMKYFFRNSHDIGSVWESTTFSTDSLWDRIFDRDNKNVKGKQKDLSRWRIVYEGFF